MKKTLLVLVVFLAVISCKKEDLENSHVAGAECTSCHGIEKDQWSSAANHHALPAIDVVGNVDHNTEELLVDDCLKCHSPFQFPLGIDHFVTPIDQTGSPAGTWTILNADDWEASKCEVCHDATATNPAKLAKYGSLIDGPWSDSYTNASDLPEAYQLILSANGDVTTYVYPDQTSLSVQATKLCSSCHDPEDRGEEDEVIENGINYGPQGGDSRSFFMSNHKGFSCIDCHDSHTFEPVIPETTTYCTPCHTGVPKTGKVHINHM